MDSSDRSTSPPTQSPFHPHLGPFDIIGDVHGCLTELTQLLQRLGWDITMQQGVAVDARHPEGRMALFLGDLVDRGPATPGVLRLVMNMTDAGQALCVCGNHEAKLLRALRGRDTTTSHGLAESLTQLQAEPDAFRDRVISYLSTLPAHLILDEGRLVAAHAGLKEEFHGADHGKARAFALFGDTTGERDEHGFPVRRDWAQHYSGAALVVYGHTPVRQPQWVNNTLCLDTAVVFGGSLTALRYPERELVSVPALQQWTPRPAHYR